MSVKIYFVESTDMYRERAIVSDQGFFSEQEADQLEKNQKDKFPDLEKIGCSYMVQELEIKYSHRNGETDDPEVEGFYWIEIEWMEQKYYAVNRWVTLAAGRKSNLPERKGWATEIFNREWIAGIHGPIPEPR